MESFAKFYLLISMLAGGVIAAAWWMAAVKKPGVALFFWLASVHTASWGLTVFNSLTGKATGWPGFFPLLLAFTVVHAVLYVQLVRWVLARP